MVLGLREVVRARCADQARECRSLAGTRVGIFECKCVTAFSLGVFRSGEGGDRGVCDAGPGCARCELGDKAMIVIVRGGVDVVQSGVQAVISACRGSSFAAARYPRP